MKKILFGEIKNKVVNKLVESYSNKNKVEIKDIINTVKSDKVLSEMFLLYEDVENKHIEDYDTARLYIDELSAHLKGKSTQIFNVTNILSEKLKDTSCDDNEVYNMLDVLSENDNFLNIEQKVKAKKYLADYINKNVKEVETKEPVIYNEGLLYNILTNNFNVLYSNTLTEDEQTELKTILSLSNEETETKVNTLKETVLENVTTLLNETTDSDLKTKLNSVLDEVNKLTPSKFSYYRLSELKKGLD